MSVNVLQSQKVSFEIVIFHQKVVKNYKKDLIKYHVVKI